MRFLFHGQDCSGRGKQLRSIPRSALCPMQHHLRTALGAFGPPWATRSPGHSQSILPPVSPSPSHHPLSGQAEMRRGLHLPPMLGTHPGMSMWSCQHGAPPTRERQTPGSPKPRADTLHPRRSCSTCPPGHGDTRVDAGSAPQPLTPTPPPQIQPQRECQSLLATRRDARGRDAEGSGGSTPGCPCLGQAGL